MSLSTSLHLIRYRNRWYLRPKWFSLVLIEASLYRCKIKPGFRGNGEISLELWKWRILPGPVCMLWGHCSRKCMPWAHGYNHFIIKDTSKQNIFVWNQTYIPGLPPLYMPSFYTTSSATIRRLSSDTEYSGEGAATPCCSTRVQYRTYSIAIVYGIQTRSSQKSC